MKRTIDHIKRCTTEPQRLDPRKPMPPIICPEARPDMDRDLRTSALITLITGALVGFGMGCAITAFIIS